MDRVNSILQILNVKFNCCRLESDNYDLKPLQLCTAYVSFVVFQMRFVHSLLMPAVVKQQCKDLDSTLSQDCVCHSHTVAALEVQIVFLLLLRAKTVASVSLWFQRSILQMYLTAGAFM